MTDPDAPEFSRPLDVARLPPGESALDLVADDDECRALARRLGLVDLADLKAAVRLWPAGGGTSVRIRCHLVARVTQTCVVTLEPVAGRIDTTFERVYGPAADDDEEGGDVFLEPDEQETPEPMHHGRIDLGEAVAEQLALELDPFPRAPGAAFEGFSTAKGDGEEAESADGPFAALARLKNKPQRG